MGQQPPVDHGRLVGGQVVADHVDGQAGVGLPVDLIEEVPEVDRPVLGGQRADHLAGGGVQRGEQVDGAVPDVVMAAPLGHARAASAAPGRSAPAPGSAASRRPRRPPRSPAAPGTGPTTSRILSMSSGSGEILKSSVRQGCSPNARQMRCTLVGEMPTWRASSRLDQCVAPSGVSSRVRTTTSSTWASLMVRGTPGPGLIAQPVQPPGQEPGPPLPDSGPADAQPRGHGDVGAAVRAGQHDPRPQRQPLGGLPPLRPVLQRPPLGLGQHQRLQPRITHATSRPRTNGSRHHPAGSETKHDSRGDKGTQDRDTRSPRR